MNFILSRLAVLRENEDDADDGGVEIEFLDSQEDLNTDNGNGPNDRYDASAGRNDKYQLPTTIDGNAPVGSVDNVADQENNRSTGNTLNQQISNDRMLAFERMRRLSPELPNDQITKSESSRRAISGKRVSFDNDSANAEGTKVSDEEVDDSTRLIGKHVKKVLNENQSDGGPKNINVLDKASDKETTKGRATGGDSASESRRVSKKAAVENAVEVGSTLKSDDNVVVPVKTDADMGKEALVELLEEAAENVGRHAEDAEPYLQVLVDEWVHDLDSLLKLDKETLDRLLPLVLSREVQRLLLEASDLNKKPPIERRGGGKNRRGRSPHTNKNKDRARNVSKAPVKYKRSMNNTPQSLSASQRLTTIREERGMDDATKRKSAIGKVKNKMKQRKEAKTKKAIDKSVAAARAKYSTREELEDAIKQRLTIAETVVNAGSAGDCVDELSLCCVEQADAEVRDLIPLRLILPSISELNELMEALNASKETALKNLNMTKAQNIELDIEEVQALLTAEERYIMNKRMSAIT